MKEKVKQKSVDVIPAGAVVVPRSEHCLSRNNVSPNALKVLYRLRKAGFTAYLVGGGVRDLLLGREPKDFDVATNARPEQIRRCFRNGRLIGRRFKLVHILFKDEIIEVCTFRAEHDTEFDDDSLSDEGMILHDNVYGTLSEDAARRDFTINALYYNIADFSVLDCHRGLEDLKQGLLRVIGDPTLRYREDPVRMLRAVRFAAKLGFRIHEYSEQPIFTMGHLISQVSSARLYIEVNKLFLSSLAVNSFTLLRHYNLLKYIFPATEKTLAHGDFEFTNLFITLGLEQTDQRIREGKIVTPSFLLAVLLWYPLLEMLGTMPATMHPNQAMQTSSQKILISQLEIVAIPRRFIINAREIWLLQRFMEARKRNRVLKLLAHPRFRAAIEFLHLRSKADDKLLDLAQWWQTFYEGDETVRKEMNHALQKDLQRNRRKKSKPT